MKIIALLGIIGLFISFSFAPSSEVSPLEAKQITIVSQQGAAIAGTLATPVPTPFVCRILDKLDEKDDILAATELNVGSEDIEYTEERIAFVDGKITTLQKKQSDPLKEIALKVLHMDTCEVEVIVITKRGDALEAPSGWEIEPVIRTNGIRWNYWNTEYDIKKPAHAVVLKNKYPNIIEKKVEPIIYAPYSQAVHRPEVVERGQAYVKALVGSALDDLKSKNVTSRAYPGVLVSDVPAFAAGFFERLPIIEHADMTEFTLDPQRTTERVLVIVGLNGDQEDNVAFAYTGNSAGANGLMQFTNNATRTSSGTYSTVRQRYPKAKLISDFQAGAKDHANAMKAAILLHDLNLEYLIKKYGKSIATDPRLEEYLAALYNASPASVTKSLTASLSQQAPEWTDKLLRETKGYISKLRYLTKSNLFSQN